MFHEPMVVSDADEMKDCEAVSRATVGLSALRAGACIINLLNGIMNLVVLF